MTIILECLGCRLSNQLEPVNIIYENKYVCCLLDIEPFNEGHTLILPKQHYLDVEELNLETADAIMRASMIISKAIKKLYNPDGITICQNGGRFNDLSHYHMHVIPRYEGQPFYIEEQKGTIKEKTNLSETKAKLKNMIEELS